MSATAERKKPRRERQPKVEEKTEEQKVNEWRHEQFGRLLKEAGLSDDEVDPLLDSLVVNKEVSPHDLHKLLSYGCDPETAVRILV